mmetsp:Transcript_39642/g.91504  ORF Transcript_39642/g.91504 Transcript_39642/m.91504 type:complete len:211 (-) Transcript_39642:166-798(-)
MRLPLLILVAIGPHVFVHQALQQTWIFRLCSTTKPDQALRKEVEQVLQELIERMISEADQDDGFSMALLVERLPQDLNCLHTNVRFSCSWRTLDQWHCARQDVPNSLLLRWVQLDEVLIWPWCKRITILPGSALLQLALVKAGDVHTRALQELDLPPTLTTEQICTQSQLHELGRVLQPLQHRSHCMEVARTLNHDVSLADAEPSPVVVV